MEHERLLTTLALELSSAKESLAAVEAYTRYFRARFTPASISAQEITDATKAFEKESFFSAATDDLEFHLRLPLPVVMQVKGSKSLPTAYELQVIECAGKCFQEKMEAIAELRGLTHTDDLTGLFNQRYLELVLDREISLAKRNDSQFSILFLDLDHFKNVNDSHGHLIGSRLLFEVGQEIKRALRDSDITFRYGGDEFVIILAQTALDDAVLVAERVRVQIEKKRFLVKDNLEIRLTASIGVATVPLHAVTRQQILKAADEALYGVKKADRNKVIAATSKLGE
jgi:diguanylate cyclase (GGDEF)-like protein